ncbi:YeeE/YedE thiosulfate transporter family protein [Gynuella sp.]|uniref:YeeE/YedE thiosulfate transporter family protein n=1 Tax=Gynuella sp. TaxID=2969146 RepID=UPI003D1408C3
MKRSIYPVAPSSGKPYWNPYAAGILLGVVLFLAFLISGNGLGASGGLNRLVVWVQDALFPDHVDNTPFLLHMAGGDLNPLTNWVVFMVIGALIGGFVSGWLRGRVRLETNKGPQITPKTRWALAFVGGALMGYGARLARGCTSGQALSGGAVLSVGSWAFMFAVFAGAYLFAWTFRKAWNPGGEQS